MFVLGVSVYGSEALLVYLVVRKSAIDTAKIGYNGSSFLDYHMNLLPAHHRSL